MKKTLHALLVASVMLGALGSSTANAQMDPKKLYDQEINRNLAGTNCDKAIWTAMWAEWLSTQQALVQNTGSQLGEQIVGSSPKMGGPPSAGGAGGAGASSNPMSCVDGALKQLNSAGQALNALTAMFSGGLDAVISGGIMDQIVSKAQEWVTNKACSEINVATNKALGGALGGLNTAVGSATGAANTVSGAVKNPGTVMNSVLK